MNERIKQLAVQAGFETNEANITIGNYVQDKEYFYADDFIEDELKKFAELIVAECISTLDQDDGATHHGELLREHFGVESA